MTGKVDLSGSAVLVPHDPDWEQVDKKKQATVVSGDRKLPAAQKNLFQRIWSAFTSAVWKLIGWITSWWRGGIPMVPTTPATDQPNLRRVKSH